MSSFKATFKVNGKEYDVLSCTYSFGQVVDDKGKPASDVHGGNLSLQIVTDDDDTIIGWMIDPYKMTNGSVTFMRTDQDSSLKEVKFEDGYCVGYSESFNANSSMPMTASLKVSARKLTVGGASHEAKW